MKKIILGTGLILYAVLLTPAYFEPTDIVVSTGWIAGATAVLGAQLASVIIPLWMASGYIAVIFGVLLIGTRILRRFHLQKMRILFTHPYQISLVIVTVCVIISYLFYIRM